MDEFDIPIFKKAYELYKTFYAYRDNISRQNRFTLWQRVENLALDIIENILLASQQTKSEKLPTLERVSSNLNLLRIFIRLAKDIAVIDIKKYLAAQESIDEMGRQLGGWIKSTKAP